MPPVVAAGPPAPRLAGGDRAGRGHGRGDHGRGSAGACRGRGLRGGGEPSGPDRMAAAGRAPTVAAAVAVCAVVASLPVRIAWRRPAGRRRSPGSTGCRAAVPVAGSEELSTSADMEGDIGPPLPAGGPIRRCGNLRTGRFGGAGQGVSVSEDEDAVSDDLRPAIEILEKETGGRHFDPGVLRSRLDDLTVAAGLSAPRPATSGEESDRRRADAEAAGRSRPRRSREGPALREESLSVRTPWAKAWSTRSTAGRSMRSRAAAPRGAWTIRTRDRPRARMRRPA